MGVGSDLTIFNTIPTFFLMFKALFSCPQFVSDITFTHPIGCFFPQIYLYSGQSTIYVQLLVIIHVHCIKLSYAILKNYGMILSAEWYERNLIHEHFVIKMTRILLEGLHRHIPACMEVAINE